MTRDVGIITESNSNEEGTSIWDSDVDLEKTLQANKVVLNKVEGSGLVRAKSVSKSIKHRSMDLSDSSIFDSGVVADLPSNLSSRSSACFIALDTGV